MTEYSVEKFYNEYALKKEDSIIAVIDTGTNARKVCDLLNDQDKKIEELEKEKNSFMSDAIKFEKECKRLYNNLRLTNSDLCSEKIMHNHCKKENEQLKQQLKKDNDVSDNTKQKLKDREKAWGELFKDYMDVLKQKDGLEKENEGLKKENENQNNVLEDFMVMLNKLQAEPNNKSLQSMAKDMLQMMGKDIMGDSE